MSEIKISIIMPTYNVGKYIAKAIESVLDQSFKDWELIVVDDGSPDNSSAIAKQYADRDNRIRIVKKENGGLSDARNLGLQNAKGEYVHFFDPDDYLNDHFYNYLYSKTVETDCDMVIAGYQVEYISRDGNSKIEKVDFPIDSNDKFDSASNLSPLRFVCYAWNKLFKREFLTNNNLQYEKGLSRIEDAEFMSRVVVYNPKVGFVSSSGYVYVQRPMQTLSKGFDETIISLAERRIGIDRTLLKFFIGNIEDDAALVNALKSSTMRSTLNRLYDVPKGNLKHPRKRYLQEIRNTLLPDKLNISNRGLKRSLFDRLTYLGLRFRMYFIINTLQKAR